jgi:hypothetical protein
MMFAIDWLVGFYESFAPGLGVPLAALSVALPAAVVIGVFLEKIGL